MGACYKTEVEVDLSELGLELPVESWKNFISALISLHLCQLFVNLLILEKSFPASMWLTDLKSQHWPPFMSKLQSQHVGAETAYDSSVPVELILEVSLYQPKSEQTTNCTLKLG